jgi:type I restriction enzyme M protein
MLTGELKSQIDQIWNAFWSGGIANPIEVIEQITYLLFLRRLDDLHTLEENKATRLKRSIERRIFPEGNNPRSRAYDTLRWGRFKNEATSTNTCLAKSPAPGKTASSTPRATSSSLWWK